MENIFDKAEMILSQNINDLPMVSSKIFQEMYVNHKDDFFSPHQTMGYIDPDTIEDLDQYILENIHNVKNEYDFCTIHASSEFDYYHKILIRYASVMYYLDFIDKLTEKGIESKKTCVSKKMDSIQTSSLEDEAKLDEYCESYDEYIDLQKHLRGYIACTVEFLDQLDKDTELEIALAPQRIYPSKHELLSCQHHITVYIPDDKE